MLSRVIFPSRIARSAILLVLCAVFAGCSNGRGSVESAQPPTSEEPPQTPPPEPPPPSEPGLPPEEPPPAPPPGTPSFSVGGTVSGLSGSGLVVQLNGAQQEAGITANGNFAFATPIADGTAYEVDVETQPANPAQTCSVQNGAGTVAGADVTNVTIVCSTQAFEVGGTVTGLSGSGLVLQRNGQDDLPIASNGSFTFPNAQASGSIYEISVSVQPLDPSQTCTVANASGTVGSGRVQNVRVTCATNNYSLSGTVTGLLGTGLVLANSSDRVEVQTDGAFTFPTSIASGGSYEVRVESSPQNPTQACTVTNGAGEIADADVTNVTVSCTTSQFTIGGTVAGLAGTGLRLQNNGVDDLEVSSDGTFAFVTAIASGQPYSVSVASQPSSPAQECTVQNGSGVVGADNVSNIQVSCVTTEFTIGGTVSGLLGSGLTLQNGSDTLAVAADGSFTFGASAINGTPYNVSVAAQPSSPTQVCEVANGAGTINGANVTNVQVNCTTSSFTVSAAITGISGFFPFVQIQNNGSDLINAFDDDTYTFATPVQSGQPYNVQVVGGTLTCTVIGGEGIMGGENVTVQITCTN